LFFLFFAETNVLMQLSEYRTGGISDAVPERAAAADIPGDPYAKATS